MRAIKIDAEKQTVEEIELEPGKTLEGMQAAVNGLIEYGDRFANGDALFVDEEGLFKNYERGFVYMRENGQVQTFCGNGIIVGTSPAGDTIAAGTPLADVKRRVSMALVKGMPGVKSRRS